jgi:hypothetical protein
MGCRKRNLTIKCVWGQLRSVLRKQSRYQQLLHTSTFICVASGDGKCPMHTRWPLLHTCCIIRTLYASKEQTRSRTRTWTVLPLERIDAVLHPRSLANILRLLVHQTTMAFFMKVVDHNVQVTIPESTSSDNLLVASTRTSTNHQLTTGQCELIGVPPTPFVNSSALQHARNDRQQGSDQGSLLLMRHTVFFSFQLGIKVAWLFFPHCNGKTPCRWFVRVLVLVHVFHIPVAALCPGSETSAS